MESFTVHVDRKVQRGLRKLPRPVQRAFAFLLLDLESEGPIQKGWANFSALGPGRYHCHLNYSYVACWTHDKGSIEIEVYYAGSRQAAPY